MTVYALCLDFCAVEENRAVLYFKAFEADGQADVFAAGVNIKAVKAGRFKTPELRVFQCDVCAVRSRADCYAFGRNQPEIKTVNSRYFRFEASAGQVFINGYIKVNVFYMLPVSFGNENLSENSR